MISIELEKRLKEKNWVIEINDSKQMSDFLLALSVINIRWRSGLNAYNTPINFKGNGFVGFGENDIGITFANEIIFFPDEENLTRKVVFSNQNKLITFK